MGTIDTSKLTLDMSYIKRIFAMALITVAVIFIIIVAMNDPSTFVINTYVYVIIILFLIFGIFIYFISSFQAKDRGQVFIFLFFAFLTIGLIIGSIYFINHLGILKFFTPNLMLNILLVCIGLLALSIIYILFLTKYIAHGTWGSFIINFIFYIPCLFGDIFTYLLKDFVTTPKSVFHLLFVEFILVLIYVYFYPKIQQSTIDNGVVLVSNPVMLNIKTRIDGPLYQSFYNKMEDPLTNKIDISSPLRSTFSIGMWIFLNIQSFTQLTYKNELNLFEYSSPDPKNCGCTSHPKVTYKNNQNGLDEYRFYLSPNVENTESIHYSKSLPHQKWNYLVFNYRDGAVDIFINGVFETSVVIPVPLVFTNQDIISIGQYDLNGKDRSGIYGSICNAVYYRNILTKGQIISNYNLLNIKSPPI